MTMTDPYIRKSSEEHRSEDRFVRDARRRAHVDLGKVKKLRADSSEIAARVREQVHRNAWAETVRKALEGEDDE